MPTYPTVYTFLTKNDMVVRVRPLRLEDAPYLVDLFENMSQDSRYSRFLQTLENIEMERVWSTAEQIAHGVAVNSHGLLAFCDTAERPDVPVAAARYIRLDSGQAEIGISVRDDMQGVGIGSRLLALLVDDGRDEGIHEMVAVIQNNNIVVWRLLRGLGYPITHRQEGTATEVTLDVSDPAGWEDAAADYSPEPQLIGY
jgi:acetyltransferase